MKKFLFHDLRLLSRKERSARKIVFHPKATVLKGENDTGKSSILKAIPWCLGAEPAKKNNKWSELDIAAALRFSVDGVQYTAVRHNKQLALFDDCEQMLISTNSVSREFGPYFAKLVDFEFTLTDRANKPIVPPPAFWLLPFYTDQDKGWDGSWCSFANLSQFEKYKLPVAEYHIGYRSNRYYQLRADMNIKQAELEQPKLQEGALLGALKQVKARFENISVDFDIERFQAEVAELVKEAEHLAAEEEEYRLKMGELSSQHMFYRQQLDIAKRTMRELDADYKFATKQPAEVECPTCGAKYENTIAERFSIAFDKHECEALITDIQVKMRDISAKIETKRAEMSSVRQRHEKIWQLLSTKREAISLQEILQGEARGQALEVIQSEADNIRNTIQQIENDIKEIGSQIKELDSKELRENLLSRFWDKLNAYCVKLNVQAPNPSRQTFAPVLHETGSDLPRLVLAHNFAVLGMAWENGTCAHGSVILDSPHQQDPDPVNRKTVCDFIKATMPMDSQLILALVDPCGVDFGGDVIELTKPRSMLDTEQYHSVGGEISVLLNAMYDAVT